MNANPNALRPPASVRLLACAALAMLACSPAPPNLLLVTLDTTRPDHLSVYGHPYRTTPRLEELAREAQLFERALSTTNWTLAAHASLFTGRFPRSHGANYDAAGPLALGDAIAGKARYADYTARPLPRSQTTLAELLGQRGWSTAAVVAGPWMKRLFGLDAGFEFYDDDGIEAMQGRLAESVSDAALAWLETRADDRPFFLFLNYYDPHGPYADPKGHAARFVRPAEGRTDEQRIRDGLAALYDGEIFYADEQLGRVLDWLRDRGLHENTLIVVTADHGELLGEHGGVGHGSSMFEEELRIPLLIKPARPSPQPARRSEAVQLLDVFAMILAELGIEKPEGVQGGLPPAIGHPLYAETAIPIDGGRFAWQVLYEPPHKLHWNPTGAHRLYDLARDPAERRDLARARVRVRKQLEARLENFARGLPTPADPQAPAVLDEQTRKLLEGLGYLEAAPQTDGGATR